MNNELKKNLFINFKLERNEKFLKIEEKKVILDFIMQIFLRLSFSNTNVRIE